MMCCELNDEWQTESSGAAQSDKRLRNREPYTHTHVCARVESADVNIKEPLNGGAQRTIILAWMEERNFKRAAIVKERALMADVEMTSTRN